MTEWQTIEFKVKQRVEEIKSTNQPVLLSFADIKDALKPKKVCAIFHTKWDIETVFKGIVSLALNYSSPPKTEDEKQQIVGLVQLSDNPRPIANGLIRQYTDGVLNYLNIQALYEQCSQIPLYIREAGSFQIVEAMEDLRSLKRMHGLDVAFVTGIKDSDINEGMMDALKVFAEEIKIKLICSITISRDLPDLYTIDPNNIISVPLLQQPFANKLIVV